MFSGFILYIVVAATAVLGIIILQEDAGDICHVLGPTYDILPDIRWFGISMLLLPLAAFLMSRHGWISYGKLLGWSVVIFGAVAVIVPEVV